MPDKNSNVIQLHAILNDISDSVAVLNGGGGITWCNNAYRRFTALAGFDTALNQFDQFRDHAGIHLEEHATTVVNTQEPYQQEFFFSTINCWFLLKVTAVEGAVILRLLDITAQKEKLREVLIDEWNLRILINITDHPIWLVDTDCNIVLCNDAFKKWIYNFSGKQLSAGENILEKGLEATYLEKLKACYDLALTGKNFTAIEDITVGGEVKFTTINFNPVFDSNNVLKGISCHASDITDHRKNLSKIEAQTQLLMEIANIQSHKVRGPVATLLGLVQVFNFEDLSDTTNLEVMQGVAEITTKLDDIVKEVIRSINILSYRSGKYKDEQ